MILVGLDLSYTCTGMATIVPVHSGSPGWRVKGCLALFGRRRQPGQQDEEYQVSRITHIASGVIDFMRKTAPEGEPVGVSIEGPALNARSKHHMLGQLAGAVKLELYRQRGIVANIVAPTEHQSTTIGARMSKLSGEGRKEAIQAAMLAYGAPSGMKADVYDALSVANHTWVEHGGLGVIGGR